MTWAHGKLLAGSPVAVLAQGPSLNEADIDAIAAAKIPIIAIKDSSRYVIDPFAIYACDLKWWIRRWNDPGYDYLRRYNGYKVTLNWQKRKHNIQDLRVLNSAGIEGLTFSDGFVCHGRNSGTQAINWAINLGANPVIMCFFDMQHVDGKSPGVPDHVAIGKGTFRDFANYFRTMKAGLQQWGGKIVNTCMTSALDDSIFPKVPLKTILKEYGNGRS
jgi:hypothetical protein